MSFTLNKANDLVVTPWGVFIDDKAYDLDTLQEIEGLSFPHSVSPGCCLIGARSTCPYQNVNLNSYLIGTKLNAIAYNTRFYDTVVCFIENNKLYVSNNDIDFQWSCDRLEGYPLHEDDKGIWILGGRHLSLIAKTSKQGKYITTSINDYRLEKRLIHCGGSFPHVRFLKFENGFLYCISLDGNNIAYIIKIDVSLQTYNELMKTSTPSAYQLYATGYDVNEENSYLTWTWENSGNNVTLYKIEPDFSTINNIKQISLSGKKPSTISSKAVTDMLQHVVITHDVSNEKNYYTFMSIQNTSSPSYTLNKVICVDDSNNIIFEETDVKHCIKIEKDKFLIGNGYDIKLIKWSPILENWIMTSFNVGTSYLEFYLDFTGKIWIRSIDSSTFYRIAPKQGVTLVSTFEKENYGYMGEVIDSYVDLTCSDIEGLRVTVSQNVQLNGPVTFADGSKQKVINLDKNNTVRVPIKIVGHGPISCQLSF